MKINTYLSSIIDKYIKQSKTEKPQKIDIDTPKENETTNTNKELDKVEISSQAKILAQIQEEENIKNQRLEQIKSQLESGSYKPPIDKIAKSILTEWKGE